MTSDAAKQRWRAWAALDRLLEEGILPVFEGIREFALGGFVPVVIFEPSKTTEGALKALFGGRWRPDVRLVGVTRADFTRTLGTADHVTADWCSRPRAEGEIPVFVFANDGTLLLNHVYGKGWSIEPGSTDTEMAVWRSN